MTSKKSPSTGSSKPRSKSAAKKKATPKSDPSAAKTQTEQTKTTSDVPFDFAALPSLPPEDVAKLEEVSRNVMQSALKSQKVLPPQSRVEGSRDP